MSLTAHLPAERIPTRPRTEALALLGLRLCLAPLFVYSGVGKVVNFNVTAGRLPGGADGLGSALAAGAIALELGATAALLLGFYTRQAALALMLFTVAATLMFHNFWAVPEAQVVAQTINFLKNVCLVGAFAVLAAFGAGPYALDTSR